MPFLVKDDSQIWRAEVRSCKVGWKPCYELHFLGDLISSFSFTFKFESEASRTDDALSLWSLTPTSMHSASSCLSSLLSYSPSLCQIVHVSITRAPKATLPFLAFPTALEHPSLPLSHILYLASPLLCLANTLSTPRTLNLLSEQER